MFIYLYFFFKLVISMRKILSGYSTPGLFFLASFKFSSFVCLDKCKMYIILNVYYGVADRMFK